MTFIKKHTFEQHDNESGSYYKSSVKAFENGEILENNLDIESVILNRCGYEYHGVALAKQLINEKIIRLCG